MWSSPAGVNQALGRVPHPEPLGCSLLFPQPVKHTDGFLS